MRLTESQFVRMTQRDKHLLLKLAESEERSPSDVIRRLIRQAARALETSSGSKTAIARPESQVQDA